MIDALPDGPTPSAPKPKTGRRSTIRLLTAFAVAVVVLVTIGIVVTRHGSSAGSQQLTSTERACQQWTSSYAPRDGTAPTRIWCAEMTNWMGQQLHSGHMSGTMMWSDSTSMGRTCRQWMSTGPAAASGVSAQVCDDMVGWMTVHTSNWANWMMTGHMMGQGP